MLQSTEAESHSSEWIDGSTVLSQSATIVTQRPRRERKARGRISSPISSAELSLEDLTDGDEFALLASLRAHKLNNFIYNNNDNSKGSREWLDALSDFANTCSKEQALNLAVWEVIEMEIKEWQKVCGSGRPSWWSPDTKRSRIYQVYSSQTEDILTQNEEMKCPIPFEHPRSTFRRCRALSESSIPTTTTLNDLAYLIAIQLLSACFTLPPEQISETSRSAHHYYSSRTEVLSGPKLISALRMHTHFRYSPSFGHQARNNSIANHWDNIHNGCCTPNILTNIKIKPLGSHLEESRSRKPKRRVRRVLNTTEASSIDEASPSVAHDGSVDPSEIPPSSTQTAWNRRKGLRDSNGQEITHLFQETKRINISLPPSPNAESTPKSPASKSIYTHRHCSKNSSRSDESSKHSRKDRNQRSGNVDGQQSPKDQGMNNSAKALESQIRSEPHPVFVQPVKELVIKRWRTFRSRFTHGASSPDPNNTSNDFLAESARSGEASPGHAQYIGNLKLETPPGMFTPGSITSTNSDGRERRRRARKDSQIYSGSSHETPRFNTPMSETSDMGDGLVAAMDVGRASPTIHLLDPLVPTPSSEPGTFLSPPLTPCESSRSGFVAVPRPSLQANPIPRSQSVSSPSPRGGPPPTTRSRKTRKSMLSEMHTPETYDSPAIEMSQLGHNPLSLRGSIVPSPSPNAADKLASASTTGIGQAKIPFDNATPGLETPLGESPFVETPGSVFVDWSAGNVREQAVEKVMEDDLAMERAALLERESRVVQSGLFERPRMVRMSTSGTQRFTPNEDGVEVDGLPVGPGMEEAGWTIEQKGKGRGRKMRESSFL